MKKKFFAALILTIFSLSMSSVVFASTVEVDEMANTISYVQNVREAKTDDFARMGIYVRAPYDYTNTFLAQQSLNTEPAEIKSCEYCGEAMIVNAAAIEGFRIIQTPSISRYSPYVDVRITEEDLEILIDFVIRTMDAGMPLGYTECITIALKEHGLYEIFTARIDSWVSSQKQSIVPQATTHRFSPFLPSGALAVHMASNVVSSNRITYTFALSGVATVESILLCQMTNTIFIYHHYANVSHGGGTTMPLTGHPWSTQFGLWNRGTSATHASITFTIF